MLHPRLEQLADQCLDRIAREGVGVIDEICSEHPDSAAELRLILDNLAGVGLIGGQAPAETLDGTALPRVLGDFRLESLLGRGGMGMVYEAEQISLGRRVAVKLLRQDIPLTPSARARFSREIAALAQLDHPGICTVYEADEVEGTPYLAMRLVDGESLAARIDRTPREPGQAGWTDAVVHWMEQVARAVHAAHEAGFLHRDIKPANIMIDEHDQPVVLDFGLAREVQRETLGLTGTADQPGTPAYMAPEQIDGTIGAVDRRTDVYGLGATLYECLALRPPFFESTREALFRAILTGGPSAAALLDRHVPADLRVVVHRALDPDKRRRFATAAELADELERIRDHRPILTRPPGPFLRSWRLAQRHPVRATALVALCVGLLLIAGALLVVLDQRDRARAAEQQVRKEAARARTVVAMVEALLRGANVSEARGADFPVRRLLDEFDRDLGDKLVDEPEVHASVLRLIGDAYLSLGVVDKAEPHLAKALAIRQRLFGGDHVLVAESLDDWALLQQMREDFDGSLATLDRLRDMVLRLHGQRSDAAARVMAERSHLLRMLGRFDESTQQARASLAILRELHGADSIATVEALRALGTVELDTCRWHDAASTWRKVLSIDKREAHTDVAMARSQLASATLNLGDTDGAETLLLEALAVQRNCYGDTHPGVAQTLAHLGVLYNRRGDHAEAVTQLSAALEIFDRNGPDRSVRATQARAALGVARVHLGDVAAGERILRQCLGDLVRRFGDDHRHVADVRNALGFALNLLGRPAEAEEQLARAWEHWKEHRGEGDPDALGAAEQLAQARMLQGKQDAAEQTLRRALDAAGAAPDTAYAVARLRHRLAILLDSTRRLEESIPTYELALAGLRSCRPPRAADIACVLNDLGWALIESRDLERAEQVLEEARDIWRDHPRRPERLFTLQHLSRCHAARDRHAAAAKVLQEAVDATRELRGETDPEVGLMYNSLARAQQCARQTSDALATLRQARELWQHHPRHEGVLDCLHQLGQYLLEGRDPTGAAEAYEQLSARVRDIRGEQHPEFAGSLSRLADAVQARGDYVEAERLLRRACTLRAELLGARDKVTLRTRLRLAQCQLVAGQHEVAEATIRDAIRDITEALGPDQADLASGYMGLAVAMQKRGAFEAATEELRRALAVADRTLPPGSPGTARILEALLAAAQRSGDAEGAARWRARLAAISRKR